jgi:hypothetical protein
MFEQSNLRLDATRVIRTWCGRKAELGLRGRDEGVNSFRERAYEVEIRDCGDKSRSSRRGCGRVAMSGGDENTVVSRVMRRISHFLRCASRASGAGAMGGGNRANAELKRVRVTVTSRCRNALAARL